MSRQNEEQLEALEINTTPRIVITRENLFVFQSSRIPEITLKWDELHAAVLLMRALEREETKGDVE